MSYTNPVNVSYTLSASAIAAASVKLSVVGPKGLKGRLVGISAVITTDTTVAASVIQVGVSGTAAKHGSLSVPVAVADSAYNDATLLTDQDNEMPADTAVEIASDGGSTAGAADLVVVIAWY